MCQIFISHIEKVFSYPKYGLAPHKFFKKLFSLHILLVLGVVSLRDDNAN